MNMEHDLSAVDVQLLHKRLFDASNGHALSDQELLVELFSMTVPLNEAQLFAANLMGEYRCLSDVLSNRTSQKGVPIHLQRLLKLMRIMLLRASAQTLEKRPLLGNWEQLLCYLQLSLGQETRENLRVLFLNRRNHLLKDHLVAVGTIDHVPVYPREILKAALKVNAGAMILVHNHPTGDPAPSDADKHMTRIIQTGAEALGIALHDHIIVGAQGHFSFKTEGLL